MYSEGSVSRTSFPLSVVKVSNVLWSAPQVREEAARVQMVFCRPLASSPTSPTSPVSFISFFRLSALRPLASDIARINYVCVCCDNLVLPLTAYNRQVEVHVIMYHRIANAKFNPEVWRSDL